MVGIKVPGIVTRQAVEVAAAVAYRDFPDFIPLAIQAEYVIAPG